MTRSVTILGAGLVGSLLAIILRKRGYQVEIYERRSDMRTGKMSAGRSINLAMSARGWRALELAGLRQDIEELATPMFGRYLHQIGGTSAFQQYGKNKEAIYSVSRGELNQKLMNLAERNGVKIFFDHKCTKVEVATNTLHFQLENGDKKVVKADLLFGADGAFSVLRNSYCHLDRVNSSQTFLEHGYKELCIPPEVGCKMNTEKNALHIWPRKNFMMIALPNLDSSFTCTLFFPFEGTPSFDQLKTKSEVLEFFEEQFPDAIPLMPTLLDDFFKNPTSSLVMTQISSWHYGDKSALIGDAAHAIVPFYGQGMNAGFEDCTVIAELLERYDDDWELILNTYAKMRKPNADAVAQLALLNFVEMRDKVADPVFLERKKIERELGIAYPKKFTSVYEMVSFTHTSYKIALECVQAQDMLMGRIMKEGDFFKNETKEGWKEWLDAMIDEYDQKMQDLRKEFEFF